MRLFLQSTRIAISFSSNRTKFYWLKFCLYLQHYSYNIKNLVRENKDTWGFNVIADESISYIRLFQCSDILYTYYFNHSSSHSFPRLFQISRNSFTFKLITLILGYAAQRSEFLKGWKFVRLANPWHGKSLTLRKFRRLAVQKFERQKRGQILGRYGRKKVIFHLVRQFRSQQRFYVN